METKRIELNQCLSVALLNIITANDIHELNTALKKVIHINAQKLKLAPC